MLSRLWTHCSQFLKISRQTSVLSIDDCYIELFNYKEAEYDLLMAWLDILITQKTATEQACFELLLRIRDECVKYLPDLKLSFVNQM